MIYSVPNSDYLLYLVEDDANRNYVYGGLYITTIENLELLLGNVISVKTVNDNILALTADETYIIIYKLNKKNIDNRSPELLFIQGDNTYYNLLEYVNGCYILFSRNNGLLKYSFDLYNWKTLDLSSYYPSYLFVKDDTHFCIYNTGYNSSGFSPDIVTFEVNKEEELLINVDNKIDKKHLNLEVLETNITNIEEKVNAIPTIYTDDYTIIKDDENVISTSNIKIPYIVKNTILKNSTHSPVYIYGDSSNDYCSLEVDKIRNHHRFSFITYNKINATNTHYKQCFSFRYFTKDFIIDSGIKEFEFNLDSNISSVYGENYTINIKDFYIPNHLNSFFYESKDACRVRIVILFTIANADKTKVDLYGCYCTFNNKNIIYNTNIAYTFSSSTLIKSLEKDCLVSIEGKKYRDALGNFGDEITFSDNISLGLMLLDSSNHYSSFSILNLALSITSSPTTYSFTISNETSYTFTDSISFDYEINDFDYESDTYKKYVYLYIKNGFDSFYQCEESNTNFELIYEKNSSYVTSGSFGNRLYKVSDNCVLYSKYNNTTRKDEIICNVNNNSYSISNIVDPSTSTISFVIDYSKINNIVEFILGYCTSSLSGSNLYINKISIDTETNVVENINLEKMLLLNNSSDQLLDVCVYQVKDYTSSSSDNNENLYYLTFIGKGQGFYESIRANGWFDIILKSQIIKNEYLYNTYKFNTNIIEPLNIDNNTIYKYKDIYRFAPPIGSCYTVYDNNTDPNDLYIGTVWEEIQLESVISGITVYKRIR